MLDEPLSAVDAHVAQWLFDQVLGSQGCLANKTRIVVTHRIHFAPQADLVVVMREGQIHAVGTCEGMCTRSAAWS